MELTAVEKLQELGVVTYYDTNKELLMVMDETGIRMAGHEEVKLHKLAIEEYERK